MNSLNDIRLYFAIVSNGYGTFRTLGNGFTHSRCQALALDVTSRETKRRPLSSKGLPWTMMQFLPSTQPVKRGRQLQNFRRTRAQSGAFPKAKSYDDNAPEEVTVWCSNDYLGMGQNPIVQNAMKDVIDSCGWVQVALEIFLVLITIIYF